MGKHALDGVEGFVRRGEVFFVDPRVLVVEEGFNPRQSYGDAEDIALKENIKQNGVTEPLKIQKTEDGKLVVRNGHRRRWACRELAKEGFVVKGVPVQLTDKKLTRDGLLLLALNTDTAKPFTPFEVAGALNRLVNNGHKVKDIAASIGRSEGYVYERLKLVNATPQTRQAVEAGEVSVKAAANAAGRANGDEKAQEKAVKTAKEKPKRVVMKYDKRKDDHTVKGATDDQKAFLLSALDTDFWQGLAELGLDANSFIFTVNVRAAQGPQQEQLPIPEGGNQ